MAVLLGLGTIFATLITLSLVQTLTHPSPRLEDLWAKTRTRESLVGFFISSANDCFHCLSLTLNGRFPIYPIQPLNHSSPDVS